MCTTPNEISVERLLGQDIPELVGYHNDIVMVNNFDDMSLLRHPVRLRATTVLVCLKGTILCSVNLRDFEVTENQILVNFSGDIIQIKKMDNMVGYAIIISEEYLQQLQLDFRLRVQSYIRLRDNGPISVPYEELALLKPYYILLKSNMTEGNSEVIMGLTLALSHTIILLMRKYQARNYAEVERNESRAQQIFDRFMKLLGLYHTKGRSLQFYAEKMCLTPKYVSGMVKAYSGKSALDWINDYVVMEAKMMLRYTEKSVQEISYTLNFPTQSAFGKYFKQQTGLSPRQYRTVDV